jgi:2-methylcitrate dehydratase PrpD
VQLLRGFMAQHGFGGDDIRELTIAASDKVASHHNERDPADIMLAQYSVPFCSAIAAYHDPLDPAVFCDRVVAEPRVRALAKRINVEADEKLKGWGARMRVVLADGRSFDGASDTWLGCPETPLSVEQLRGKFDRMVAGASPKLRSSLFDDLMRLEQLPSLAGLALA